MCIYARAQMNKKHRNDFFLIFLVTFFCVIIYNVNREKENIEVLFSRYLSVRTTRDNDHTYTQTNRHKKKEEKKKKEHE